MAGGGGVGLGLGDGYRECGQAEFSVGLKEEEMEMGEKLRVLLVGAI